MPWNGLRLWKSWYKCKLIFFSSCTVKHKITAFSQVQKTSRLPNAQLSRTSASHVSIATRGDCSAPQMFNIFNSIFIDLNESHVLPFSAYRSIPFLRKNILSVPDIPLCCRNLIWLLTLVRIPEQRLPAECARSPESQRIVRRAPVLKAPVGVFWGFGGCIFHQAWTRETFIQVGNHRDRQTGNDSFDQDGCHFLGMFDMNLSCWWCGGYINFYTLLQIIIPQMPAIIIQQQQKAILNSVSILEYESSSTIND